MQNFLFIVYQFFCILIFLFLSTILLYNRLFQRWIFFSIGFFVIYSFGSFLFFGRLSIPLDKNILQILVYFLFFFGTAACIGFCLLYQLNLRQSIGIILCYFFVLSGFSLLILGTAGLRLPKDSVENFLSSLPYILFYVGSPIIIGACLYRGMCFKQIFGIYLIFCGSLAMSIVATTNYFQRPFGLYYMLNPYTKLWLEIGSALLIIAGLPAVIGACFFHSLAPKQTLGVLLIFLSIVTLVLVSVHMTIGFEFLPLLLRRVLRG